MPSKFVCAKCYAPVTGNNPCRDHPEAKFLLRENVPPPSEAERRNGYELYVVPTDKLVHFLRPWIITWNERHPRDIYDIHKEKIINDVHQIRAYEALAEAAGVSIRRIETLMNGGGKFTVLSLADALLACADLNFLLETGDIPVVPNPNFSQEAWIERMKERGCIVE